MPNRAYAIEWLDLARKNLETARLLYKEDHYTDIIAIEIQQTFEKSFKAVYAYYGMDIPRTHVLQSLYTFVQEKLTLPIEIEDIIIISDYYESDRYPGPRYFIPGKEEITNNLALAEKVFSLISKHIENSETLKH